MFLQILLRCLLIIFLILSSGAFFSDSALALLRQHHDAPGVLRYHSQVSIKDDFGYTWQVVLYKLFQPGKSEEINLRLVGFPGVVEFAHPQNLEILTAKGKLLSASDVYAKTSPAPNVGEYKLTDVLQKLPSTDSLKIYLPIQREKPLVLNISNAVVTEWQWLVTDVN
ncbi:MAG: DUF3122 domain-containing protein [Cyanomargarita calcarea GSE-NOS-MK-12-04C]|uniref:DUF3122 domain-containing protein n=1 Tax=Cyanomargarita calcarea GSE-NOS-MK-12-04C TaxID=2839659 RepID=A0A951QJ63_9CYAN|nr:DUF3122 domain-containing protein [Cyanomargarita calcarea GSE-NOS-MK-12-04C]